MMEIPKVADNIFKPEEEVRLNTYSLVRTNQGRCRYGRLTNADVFGQKQKQKMFLSHRKQIALCFFLSAEGGFYRVGSYFRMGPGNPPLAECSPHVQCTLSRKRVDDIFPHLLHIIELYKRKVSQNILEISICPDLLNFHLVCSCVSMSVYLCHVSLCVYL